MLQENAYTRRWPVQLKTLSKRELHFPASKESSPNTKLDSLAVRSMHPAAVSGTQAAIYQRSITREKLLPAALKQQEILKLIYGQRGAKFTLKSIQQIAEVEPSCSSKNEVVRESSDNVFEKRLAALREEEEEE
jgi:hypothetical protein